MGYLAENYDFDLYDFIMGEAEGEAIVNELNRKHRLDLELEKD